MPVISSKNFKKIQSNVYEYSHHRLTSKKFLVSFLQKQQIIRLSDNSLFLVIFLCSVVTPLVFAYPKFAFFIAFSGLLLITLPLRKKINGILKLCEVVDKNKIRIKNKSN